jgi:hypothetical protein
MDGINALIAQGVGTQYPGFDYAKSNQNALLSKNLGLRNQLLQQEVQANPAQQKLSEQAMALKSMALDVQAKALGTKQPGKIKMDLPEWGISLEGDKDAIAGAAGLAAQYPEQMNDPNFMPWLADQGISVTQLKPETTKAQKAYLTPQNTVEYLPNDIKPPKGWVPYTSGISFEQTTPEGGTTSVQIGGLPKKGGAEKPLPPQQAIDLSTYKSLSDRISTLVDKISDPNFKDITGPIEGRFQQLKVKYMADGPTQETINELNSLITIAYALSGKQISEKELKMLREAMLPRLTQPKENLLATLNFVAKWVKVEHDNRLDYLKKSGYKTDVQPLGETESPKTIGRFQVEVE